MRTRLLTPRDPLCIFETASGAPSALEGDSSEATAMASSVASLGKLLCGPIRVGVRRVWWVGIASRWTAGRSVFTTLRVLRGKLSVSTGLANVGENIWNKLTVVGNTAGCCFVQHDSFHKATVKAMFDRIPLAEGIA